MTFKTRPQVPMQDLKTPIAKYPHAETNSDSMKSISVCMFLFCFSLSTATAQTPSAKTVDAGQLAAMVVYDPKEGDPSSTDKVEQISSKVNFQIQIYPGGGYIPEKIPSDAPPAFLLAAIDDKGPAKTLLGLAEKYRDAGRPVELHLFSQGGHAFNMGKRSKLITIREWSNRMADWMNDSKLLGILPLD